MIKQVYIIFLFSFSVYAQNNSEWKKLLSSAHQVGFCLYNSKDSFCNSHKFRFNELKENLKIEENDLHYFTMKEEWANKRLSDWVEVNNLPKESLVLFFNINQGFESDLGKIGNKPSGFFIASLKDNLQFKILEIYKKQAMRCAIFHKNKPNILFNNLWREFMSGRLGLIENKIEFAIYNEKKIQKKFKKFKRLFFKYKRAN